VHVEFECVVCGETATGRVDDEAVPEDGPIQTLRDCPNCGIETIWLG
jgi:predicted RNA-binding Zn-ribbon protein involved in translation (DUF1610 family)